VVVYTVEFEHDIITVISLDEDDIFNDIEVTLTDNGSVFISQHDDRLDHTEMLLISYKQLLDIVAAVNSPEGMFKLQRRNW
jgi:hypothetical protein